jgi:hypothetical protein
LASFAVIWSALAFVGLFPIIFAGVVLLRPDLMPDWATGSPVAAVAPPESSPTSPSLDLGEDERARREREKERLAKRERQEQKKGGDAKAAAEAQAKVEEEKKQQEDERPAQIERENQRREQNAKTTQAEQAFAALKKMPEIVVKDLVTGADLGATKLNDVDLGPFDIEALESPGFELAIPKDVCDGTPFKAWVEAAGDERSWKILAAGRSEVGGVALPTHLATLVARDGNLHLSAASAAAAKSPRFNLLRRSVLLVKARDPEEADGTAMVQRAIQLVRPASGQLQWEVSLLGDRKQFALPRPIRTTVKADGGADAPVMALDAQIRYEVRYDYPLQFQEGKPAEQPVVYKFDADGFCPLLECPPPNKSKPNERPQVGVDVKVSFAEGVIAIRPEVAGPAKEDVELAALAEFVAKLDREFDNWLKNKVMLPVQLQVAVIKRQPVVKFQGSPAEQKWLQFIQVHRSSLDEFFAAQGWFPSAGYNRGRVERWSDVCRGIVDRAARATDATEARAANEQWQKDMVSPLEAWLEHYQTEMRNQLNEHRLSLKPLSSPATIVVREISSPAYDAEGKRYDVVLAAAADEPPARRESAGPRASFDLD